MAKIKIALRCMWKCLNVNDDDDDDDDTNK
jgi:hypothetical protein